MRRAVAMRIQKRLGGLPGLLLSFLLVNACVAAQTPLQTIDMPQGGRIVYGSLAGANTQEAAMAAVLRNMHQTCGEKPQLGSVFKMRGTDSVGVFFTVVNHLAGNIPVAGLIISAGGDSQEAALVSDKADHFGTTINPMLATLFGQWHPAGVSVAVPLHTVTLDDNSASVRIPEDWKLEPGWSNGSMRVLGPHGEVIVLDVEFNAVDVKRRKMRHFGGDPLEKYQQKVIVRPYDADLVKAFPEIIQQIRDALGRGPAKLEITHGVPVPAIQGRRCVRIAGTVDPDGKGDCEMKALLCATDPDGWGEYLFRLTESVLPKAVADQQRATAEAIVASFQSNMALVEAERASQTRQFIDDPVEPMERRFSEEMAERARISRLEGDTTTWKNGQWFGNFLLDPTLIWEVEHTGPHATAWTLAADFWAKAHPNRIEETPSSEYLKGQEY